MKKVLKIFSVFLIITSFFSICAAIITFGYLSKFNDAHVDDRLLEISDITEPTQFYYYNLTSRERRDGKEMLVEKATLDSGIKYCFIPFSEIPKDLINAFVAIEDKRFYDHAGVDVYRSTRAAINYLFKGRSNFGGSTITQQLVKNLTGDSEISSKRKIKEAFCALNLEAERDKSEILELYLNIINLSDGCRGIGAAAEHFYSKIPSELTLSECATIASITNNPSKYNPRLHPENVIKRRNVILKKMLDLGYISNSRYEQAKAEPININISQSFNEETNSWYVDMVIDDVITDLTEKYGVSREYASFMLYRGGYKIYTAMDISVQEILDEYYSDLSNFPCDENGSFPQASMLILDQSTGDILGVAGAIGKKTANRIQNYATQAKRPSGSAIKPLSIYVPAFENGIVNWSSIIEDSPIATISDRPWPSNANGKYIGNVTIKYAIEHSLNTVPVKLLEKLGSDKSFEFLTNKLNIKNLDSSADTGSASLALGQSSKGITLRELTGGYTIFSNGIMSKPRSYYKVTDSNGRIILDNTANQEKVISSENAAIMTKLLEGVIEDGTARGYISLDERISVAGKTGTTQGNCDRFFIGYTPDLLAGVWFGYDYPKSLDEFGGNYAAIFWDEVMTKIYEETDYENASSDFTVPHGVQKLTYNKVTGSAPTPEDDPAILEDGWFTEAEDHIFD